MSPPRTKKNSPIIVAGLKHPILLPSRAYTDWLRDILKGRTELYSKLANQGAELPFRNSVKVRAMVYRDRDVGDWLGFMEAIADAIQCPMYRCTDKHCRKRFWIRRIGDRCYCGEQLKQTRKGLGIIVDDKQVLYFDGVPLQVDRQRPRVEVELTVLEEAQKGLFEMETEDESYKRAPLGSEV